MCVSNQPDNEQSTLWNGPAGRAWVDNQKLLDQMFQPFEDLLVDAVRARGGSRVLDVGCGAGSTTLALARLLAGRGSCSGIDISEPLIAAARARAERERIAARFICADAQNYAFDAGSFDSIISRFGIMFFEDPVQAFANLRGATTEDAELRFIAWRSPAENPFMTTAERSAAPFLPNLPERRPEAPGQFAFSDPRRIQAILDESGWAEIDIHPIDVVCTLPEKELTRLLSRHGPVGLALEQADDATRTQIIQTVRAAFDSYVHEGEVRYSAACWMVNAVPHRHMQVNVKSN